MLQFRFFHFLEKALLMFVLGVYVRLQLSKFGAILIYRTGGPEKFCQKAALRIFKQFTRKKKPGTESPF